MNFNHLVANQRRNRGEYLKNGVYRLRGIDVKRERKRSATNHSVQLSEVLLFIILKRELGRVREII